MEVFDIKTEITVLQYTELDAKRKKLIEKAKEACADSYSPYSDFSVGAALELENGLFFKANNQENAAYPSGMCAERSLLYYVKANHAREPVKRIAIAAKSNGKFTKLPISPCGACRQVILETANRQKQPIELLLAGAERIYVIKDAKTLLPLQFGAEYLR